MGGLVKGIFGGGGGYKETNADRKQAAAVEAQSKMAQDIYSRYTQPEMARAMAARDSLAGLRSGLGSWLGNPGYTSPTYGSLTPGIGMGSATGVGSFLSSPNPSLAGAKFGDVMRLAGGLNRQNQTRNQSMGVMGNQAMRGIGNSTGTLNANNALQNMAALQRINLEAQLVPQQQALEAALRNEQQSNFWNALNYLTQDAQMAINPYSAVGAAGDVASQYAQMAQVQQQRQQAAAQQQASLWNTLGMLAGNFLMPGVSAVKAAVPNETLLRLTGW